ncbi:MAG: glycosyltransferase family 4 protein [Bacteroides sp.]|nr:glycosyltransferase family 4 protein [Bacteroides sp.]
MKVLLVIESLGSGGAERQLTLLASLLKATGNEPIVVTWEDLNFFGEFLKVHSVRHILLRPESRIDRMLKVAALMKSERPDAVVSYLPMANETVALARLLCPGIRTRLIVSERSFTVNWNIRRRLTNLLYRVADYVVANSNNEADNIRRHCPSLAHKTLAIPNMVDLERYIKIPSRKFDKPLRLVGVGRVIPSKNLERLADALQIVRQRGFQFRLKWYGALYDKQCVESVKRSISENGLTDCFSLEGAVTDIPKVYAEADAFVFPTLLEGYPNVLIEAMASGLSVAVSAVCELPNIVTDGENGFLFDPTDVESMADAICRLCSLSFVEANQIAERNRNYAELNNSPESFLRRYLEILS